MRSITEARNALFTPEADDALKTKHKRVLTKAYELIEVMWETAYPSPELTTSIRKLEECLMWHGKAMANELK